MSVRVFRLGCGHFRMVDAATLMPHAGAKHLLYCDFCRDNKIILEALKVQEQSFEPPEVTTDTYLVTKDSVMITLSNGWKTTLSDVVMTDLVKQWEIQNTFPAAFFNFYKQMQLRVTVRGSLPPSESKGYLIKLCRDAVDDFLRTGKPTFLLDGANALAVLYTRNL